jgi:Ca2+-binding RTX toxin-like protein
MGKKRATFYGTSADDVFAAVHGDDFVYAGDGDDVIQDNGRSYDHDFYSGQEGDDFIFTHGGNDVLKGGTGSDTVEAHNQQDFTFDGGFGNDSIDFQVLIGHSVDFSYPDADKTVVKIIDDVTDDVVQKIVLTDVENITWYMVG